MERDVLSGFVRPRVLDAQTGASESVLLEDALERRAARREFGPIVIEGPPGSGKRTALEFARRHFTGRSDIAVGGARVPQECVCLVAGQSPDGLPLDRWLTLAPWTRDEWIEYLLANHREACASVMARLEHAERHLALRGNALAWSAILDELARDRTLADDLAGLRAALRARFSSSGAQALARALLLRSLSHHGPTDELASFAATEPRVAPLLAVPSAQLLLVAEGVVQSL